MLALPAFKSLSTGLGDTSLLIKSLTALKYPDDMIRKDITLLENYRNLAVNVVDPSEMGQHHLLNYCHHLKNCLNRFNGLENLKLSFTWNDAFGINLKVTSNSLYLDYICCVWNLASFESLMGTKGDRSTEDGIRIANKHFQQSAGYLEYLRTHLLQYTSLIDNADKNLPTITDDGLTMAKNLMLAQAQLCFYEKAVKDKKVGNMKSVIIAKLAKQTSIFYASASVYCKVGLLGKILDISWFVITDFQSKVSLGAAEYWQANASKEAALASGTGYGEEVARLKRADIHISQALGVAANNPIAEGIVHGANGLRSAILEHKHNAERDLQTVYMEAIPRETDLVDITPVAMVRPSALPELENTVGACVLFAYVFPPNISSLNTSYSNSIASIYQKTYETSSQLTSSIRSTISALGLPASLEAIKSQDPVPPSLWSMVKVTAAAGMEPNLLDLHYHEGGGDEGGSSKKIDTTLLEEKLHDMANVVESRDKLVKALKEIVDINITEVSSNIISSSANVNYLDAITAVHKDNLEKAHSIDDEINKGLTIQEKILSEIIKLNDVFVKARDHNPIEVEKSRVIADIDEHITKHMSNAYPYIAAVVAVGAVVIMLVWQYKLLGPYFSFFWVRPTGN